MNKNQLIGLYGFNLAVIVWFWSQNSGQLIGNDTASTMLAFGRLAGLLGALSVMTQYTLMSMAPWVEKAAGRGKLRQLHMRNGRITFSLITLHILLIIGAYTEVTHSSVIGTYLFLFNNLPYVWLASLAFWILIATVGVSLDFVRNRLPYSVWHSVHVLNYAILGLVIWHQLANGADLLASQTFRVYWVLLNLAAYANLLYFGVVKRRLIPRFDKANAR